MLKGLHKYHDEIMQAMTIRARNEDGWLSNAQDAVGLVDITYGEVHFNGEGSIDVHHLVGEVIEMLTEKLNKEDNK